MDFYEIQDIVGISSVKKKLFIKKKSNVIWGMLQQNQTK
jgi:hypothetical protein